MERQEDTATTNESSVYVPSLELTAGQAPPVAANGGVSFMSFERDGDAGTGAALGSGARPDRARHGQGVCRYAGHRTARSDRDRMGAGFPRVRRMRRLYP